MVFIDGKLRNMNMEIWLKKGKKSEERNENQ